MRQLCLHRLLILTNMKQYKVVQPCMGTIPGNHDSPGYVLNVTEILLWELFARLCLFALFVLLCVQVILGGGVVRMFLVLIGATQLQKWSLQHWCSLTFSLPAADRAAGYDWKQKWLRL